MMYCPNCGNQAGEASFCNQCGTAVPKPEQQAPPPEPSALPEEQPPEEQAAVIESQPEPPPEAPPAPESEPPPEPQIIPEPLPVPQAPSTEYPPQPPVAGYPPAPQAPNAEYPPAPPPPHHHHQQYPPQNYAYHQPVQQGFIGDVYSKSFEFLFQKPVLLWGLSILCTLMTSLAVMFGIVPIVWLPIVLVLELGMANIFLCGYRGMKISSTQLFEGFSTKFTRNAGGMGWRSLWLLIWGMIPVAGIFICIVKFYSYRFVPYIMLADPEIQATEALKKSIIQTKGYKGKMFLADLLIGVSVVVLTVIFFFILRIPYLGIFLTAIYVILLIVLLPLLMGTLEAVYYDKVSKENPVQ